MLLIRKLTKGKWISFSRSWMRSLRGPSTKSLIQSWTKSDLKTHIAKMISPTHPEEGVHKVHKKLQDPVQRPETADVDVNAAKMIDL